MSFLSDIGDSFEKVFTRPGKANFKDFVSVGTLTVGTPFVNSTVAAPFSAALLPFASSAPAAAPAATLMTVPGPDTLGLNALGAQVEGGTLWNADTAASVAAAGSPATVTDFVSTGLPAAGAAKAASEKSLIDTALDKASKIALISTAAKSAITPWGRATQAVKDALGIGGPRGGVSISGGPLPAGSGNAPVQKAAAPALLLAGVAVTGAVWGGLWLLKRFKR